MAELLTLLKDDALKARPSRPIWLRWLPPRWGRRIAGLATGLCVAAAAYAVGDFLRYVEKVRTWPLPASSKADGIVVLTGGSDRIEEAVGLLEAGRAKRLLITGVNQATSANALKGIAPQTASLLSCCIDLDRNALNTLGNALESARWVQEQNYKSIIVVTANYHIPRSMLELKRVLPGTRLFPYPVTPDGFHLEKWWTSPSTTRALMLEYLKYSVARLRWRFQPPTARAVSDPP